MRVIYIILDTAATAVDFTCDTAENIGHKLSWWFDAANRYDFGLYLGYILQFLAGFAIGYVAITAIKVVLAIL